MKKLSDHISEGLAAEDVTIVETVTTVVEADVKNKTNNTNEDGDDIDESLINENAITDFLGSLSTDETQALLGAVGTLGVVLTGATYSKVSDWIKKHGSPKAKGVLDKLEAFGKTAGNTAQQK